ncbi:MAG: CBS domain-containing protein [Deltaproteobacteria bacterium]|nr:CBS domain-containing protein [Deltaproteobacteria bacterium]
MQKLLVKNLMVPLESYANIHEDSFLIDAVYALEKSQKEFEASSYLHRAVLAYDDDKKIVGKLSQWDVIKCLEPKYENFGDLRSTSLSGLSPELIKSMMAKYNLWQGNLKNIHNRIADKKVKDVMYKPSEGEKIEENATIGEALHIFIIGHHQSLLVTKESEIVGILRLVDMFKLVCERIKE